MELTCSSMSRLNTATSYISNGEEMSPVKVMYKTGASFVGNVQDYKKTGSGVFTWPDGSKYDGEYMNNFRHGKGVQVWADGTRYEGGFVNDLRHGDGNIEWANGETYQGSFFKDHRHGSGTYTWPEGSTFTGTFYMDKKEGYGVFCFSNGNKFEGLYRDDEREGPGVLTYKNGCQDVGFWHGELLLKLLTAVPNAFSMCEHPEFDYYPEDMTVDITPKASRTEAVKTVLEPPAIFNYSPEVSVTDRISELYSEDLDPRSLAVNRQAFDTEFFKNCSDSCDPEPTSLEVWNKSPMLVKLQMHVHKHRAAVDSVEFQVRKVLNFDRSGFMSQGPLEQASEELIKMAAAGNFLRVEELLNGGTVHPDVADSQGHTALIGATVNWHEDTINVLLNSGADVNQLNDEGVSALAAGTMFYYPVESFLYNIAEKYMDKPSALEESRSDVSQSHSPTRATVPAPSGSSSTTKMERRASQLNQLNRRKSEMAALRGSKNKERLGDFEVIEETEKADQPKVVPNTPPTENGSRSPVKITVAQDSRMLLFNEEGEDQIERIIPVKKDNDRDSVLDGGEMEEGDEEDGEEAVREKEDFESNKSVHNYAIEVSDTLLERCATQLSMNERVVSREASTSEMGRARMLAIQISQHERMKDTLELLLRRGANPNASCVPMPVLFFAIKAADVDMVRTLLIKGASTPARMSKDKGGLAPLHIAAAIPGEEGDAITELLLDALADPDVRAEEDDSFLNRTLLRGQRVAQKHIHVKEDEWSKDPISPESAQLLGGRTPLQISCARDDNYKNACKVVQLLLRNKANPDLICNGFSPLALAITSGNDLAVDELLLYGADPSLALTHGVGNALCVASSTDYEHRRSITGRIQLIDQLIRAGADILAPVAIGPKRVTGTAVDYAYYKFNQSGTSGSSVEGTALSADPDTQTATLGISSLTLPSTAPAPTDPNSDRRIAHMPYHALTHTERETYNARRRLLAHVGDILRTKAVEREKSRMILEEERGVRSASPSQSFIFTGAGAPLPPGYKGKAAAKAGQVTFEPGAKDSRERRRSDSAESGGVRSGIVTIQATSASEVKRLSGQTKAQIRKPLFKYCYDCGRSVGVRLAACTRCKEVFYCSKACKLKAWNARHKEECVRVGGRSPSPTGGLKKKQSSESLTSDARDKKTLRINDSGDFDNSLNDEDVQSDQSSAASGTDLKEKEAGDKGLTEEDVALQDKTEGRRSSKKMSAETAGRKSSKEQSVETEGHKSSETTGRKSSEKLAGKSAGHKTSKNQSPKMARHKRPPARSPKRAGQKSSREQSPTKTSPRRQAEDASGKPTKHKKQYIVHFSRRPSSAPGYITYKHDPKLAICWELMDRFIATSKLQQKRGAPGRGLSHSACGMRKLPLLPPLGRRVQSGRSEGRKRVQTQDGKWVYIDNYSFE